jgi:hypothetical protein
MTMSTRWRLASVLVWASLTAMTGACQTAAEPSTATPAETPETGASTSATTSAPGDAATWQLGPEQSLQSTSTGFTALVSRLGCNGGVTGQVLAPEIHPSQSEIVVTFRVAPKEPGAAPCPSNNQVPYEVDLGEPLRGRAVVDGQCLPGGEAADTADCADGPTRFRP